MNSKPGSSKDPSTYSGGQDHDPNPDEDEDERNMDLPHPMDPLFFCDKKTHKFFWKVRSGTNKPKFRDFVFRLDTDPTWVPKEVVWQDKYRQMMREEQYCKVTFKQYYDMVMDGLMEIEQPISGDDIINAIFKMKVPLHGVDEDMSWVQVRFVTRIFIDSELDGDQLVRTLNSKAKFLQMTNTEVRMNIPKSYYTEHDVEAMGMTTATEDDQARTSVRTQNIKIGFASKPMVDITGDSQPSSSRKTKPAEFTKIHSKLMKTVDATTSKVDPTSVRKSGVWDVGKSKKTVITSPSAGI